MSDTTELEWLQVSDVASMFGVHYKTVTRWILDGRLPAIRLGEGRNHQLRVHRDELTAFVERCRGYATDPQP